jgi:hypothetical protein
MPGGDIFQNHLSQTFLFFNCRESFWQALMLNQPIEVALNFLGEPVDA